MEEQPLVKIRLILPANVHHRSGGNIYNARLAQSLRSLGAEVLIHELDGGWPSGSSADRRLLADALAGDEVHVRIIDGLIAAGGPAEIEAATAAGHRVWVLLHMAPTEEQPQGSGGLGAATGILCTASGTAEAVRQRGRSNVHVASPGVDRVEELRALPSARRASAAPHFIVVGALLPNKDQILFVEALARIKELPWTAALVGSTEADRSYAEAVQDRISHHGLEKRVEITGELFGSALDGQWRCADLSLLISRSESFGMVVLESLAHGIPVVVRKGTGAVEALGAYGAGEAIDLTAGLDPLEQFLRTWLSDATLRRKWWDAAASASHALPRWEDTARRVLGVVTGP
ncbi:glycosyltransferase family 4 protein [Arthrobacter methylotrophus]|uniref:Glycosyltransferase family 4 protein n=1 Tax=Arthrobacter methylotrophus TaxID=121291 RepID=A0ABV5UVC5_9MICC